MARVTTDDLFAAIQEYGKELPKRPPGKGWDTVPTMAKREGISRSAVRQRMAVAMERGLKIEKFTGSDYVNGQLNKQTWFRVKR